MKSLILIICLSLSAIVHAQTLEGIASYYGPQFHGRSTSTGETFDKNAYTCAAKVFPYGTILRVTNQENNRTTQVRVNDCGPHVAGRIVDLSEGAARQIDMLGKNLANVRVEVVSLGTDGPTCNRGAWSRGGRQPINWLARQAEFAVTPNVTRGANAGNNTTLTARSPNTGRTLSEILAEQNGPSSYGNSTRVEASAILSPPPVAPTGTNPDNTTAPTIQTTDTNVMDPDGPLYAVQLVAVKQRSNADAMIAKLAEAGFTDAVVLKGGDYYRVFSKPVGFRVQAEYWEERLKEAGFQGMIRRIQ